MNSPRTTQEPSINQQNSTDAQPDSTSSDDQTESNQFWIALKIIRQSKGKGKPRYLIRWEEPTAPDSWCDTINVNDKLKRVFYLTHTKTGSKKYIYWKTPRIVN